MEFIDTIPSTNCAEWRCEVCGTGYVSPSRPVCTACIGEAERIRARLATLDRLVQLAGVASLTCTNGIYAHRVSSEFMSLENAQEFHRILAGLKAEHA